MFLRSTLPALFTLVAATSALAGDKWAPIPEETWAMKQDPAKVAKGAIFLEEFLGLENRWVEHVYRLRVLSEAGKAAAQFPTLSERAYDVEGRTVTRDGKIVTFNSRKDFQTKTVVETRWEKVESTVIVPPGVTDDCVVEFRYKVPYDFMGQTTDSLGTMGTWQLAEAFPIQTYTVEVNKLFAWTWSFQTAPGVRLAQGERSGRYVLTLQNIPEVKPLPYSLDALRKVSRLVAYPNPPEFMYAAKEGGQAYWKQVGTDLWKLYFERNIDRGRGYRTLSESLRAGLPAEPQKAAALLMSRLDAAVKNVSHPTVEEKATLPKDYTPEHIKSRDLDVACKRKVSDNLGFQHLYFELLKDAGIPTLLAFVADKDQRVVNRNQPNFQQFTHFLFGIEEAGKPIFWIDPTLRFAPPGFIQADYQGTEAIAYDTKTWLPRFLTITAQPAESNRREFEYRLRLDPEEEGFTLKASFLGVYAHRERMRHLGTDAETQAKALKSQYEALTKDVVVRKAEVTHLTDPGQAPGWQVEGAIEWELGRKQAITPFPLMPWPLTVPDQLDLLRSEPINLPFLSSHRAVCRFKIPAGYKLQPGDPIEQANDFGRITWHAEVTPEGEAQVVLESRVEQLSGRSADYRAFKIFLGWIQEACQRQVLLEKE